MSLIFEWLEEYNVEYDAHELILYIRKPIPVREFSLLRRLLQPYMYKVVDIIVEGRN